MNEPNDVTAGKRSAPTGCSASYIHEWQITVKADSLTGAMDAVWNCWEAWRDGNEPICGGCPASMGERMAYTVKKANAPDNRSETQEKTNG